MYYYDPQSAGINLQSPHSLDTNSTKGFKNDFSQEQLQIYQKLLTDQKVNLSMFRDFGGWFEPGLAP